VFSIDVERCDRCGGGVRIIACIEEPEVIEKILRHLGLDGGSSGGAMARAPPAEAGLIDREARIQCRDAGGGPGRGRGRRKRTLQAPQPRP